MYPAYGVTFNVVPDSEVWAPSVPAATTDAATTRLRMLRIRLEV
jgi:hypothetical protein